MAPAIKICGIADPASVEACLAARAEYVGFNFYPPSPRHVSLDQAAILGAQARGKVQRVGVFVAPDDALLRDAVATGALDAIQLHDDAGPARAAQVRAAFGLPVWQVISVAGADDVTAAGRYAGAADRLLFDAKTPRGALPGGMGLAFDWSLLNAWRGAVPWGLAGGLNPGNVAVAVAQSGAPLVDTASGVESAPGVKDARLIAEFCAAARA